MNAARHYATPTRDVGRCWRNVPRWSEQAGQCPRRGTGPAGLCDPHRDEMRSWGVQQPAAAPPVTQHVASEAWDDLLDLDMPSWQAHIAEAVLTGAEIIRTRRGPVLTRSSR